MEYKGTDGIRNLCGLGINVIRHTIFNSAVWLPESPSLPDMIGMLECLLQNINTTHP